MTTLTIVSYDIDKSKSVDIWTWKYRTYALAVYNSFEFAETEISILVIQFLPFPGPNSAKRLIHEIPANKGGSVEHPPTPSPTPQNSFKKDQDINNFWGRGNLLLLFTTSDTDMVYGMLKLVQYNRISIQLWSSQKQPEKNCWSPAKSECSNTTCKAGMCISYFGGSFSKLQGSFQLEQILEKIGPK